MIEPERESTLNAERRSQRRLSIRLPVEIRKETTGLRQLIRTVTRNVSSGGLYLELDAAEYRPHDRLHLELTLPPAEGVSPYEGRAACTAEVTRVQPIPNDRTGSIERFGIAARFLDRLRFSY